MTKKAQIDRTIGAFMNKTTKFANGLKSTNVLKFNPENAIDNNLLADKVKNLSPNHLQIEIESTTITKRN